MVKLPSLLLLPICPIIGTLVQFNYLFIRILSNIGYRVVTDLQYHKTPCEEKKRTFPNNIHESFLKYAVIMLCNDLKGQVNITQNVKGNRPVDF